MTQDDAWQSPAISDEGKPYTVQGGREGGRQGEGEAGRGGREAESIMLLLLQAPY
jgi:hypothetical protein